MDFLADFYGNSKQKSYFSSLIKEGKYAHAYILEAPRGAGKKTFALRLAATLARKLDDAPSEQKEKKCRRILDGISPDVRMLRREEDKKSIGVDAVRDFCSTVFLTPSELNFKMYIFDEADLITPQAQNALLKIIEEPPVGVYMLLLCENALSLLSTVRSRAQKISLDTFPEHQLRSFALQRSLDGAENEEKLAFAARMAGGSIGMLQKLLNDEAFEFSAYAAAKKVIEGQVAKDRGVSYFNFLKQITDFVTVREALDALTSYLLSAYSDLMRIKCSESASVFFFTKDEADSLSMLLPMDTLTKSFAVTDSVRLNMQFHTNLSLTATLLALELWSAA